MMTLCSKKELRFQDVSMSIQVRFDLNLFDELSDYMSTFTLWILKEDNTNIH